MRYVIKFSKESDIKFVSHLDLMRTVQRVVRRAALPVEYSKGYNPHMSLSIAQPLSVGIYSQGEYLDVIFTEEVDENYIKDKLNEKAPRGIRFLEAIKVVPAGEKKIPQCMALIEAASYEIKIRYEDTSSLSNELEELLKREEWTTLKKSKSGEKVVDIKPMVKSFKYSIKGDVLQINATLSSGSKENLSPDLLSSYIKQNTKVSEENSFVDIKRMEMFTMYNQKLIEINSYLRLQK